jgi:hypothetical protein
LVLKVASSGLAWDWRTSISRMSVIGSRLDYHPQQSVLNPHAGQRHTACMRYISAPQRSHSVFSIRGGAGEAAAGTASVGARTTGRGVVGSDMWRIIAYGRIR